MRRSSPILLRLFLLGLLTAWIVQPVSAADRDQLLPAATDAVLTVNVKSLLSSDVVKKYAEKQIRQDIDKNIGLAITLKAFEFDPFTDLHSITVAVGVTKPDKPDVLVIVRGKFDLERLQGVLDQLAKSAPDKGGVSEHGKFKIYQSKEGEQPGYGCVIDAQTLVLSQNKALVEKAIDQSQDKEQVELKKELQTLLEEVDGKQTAWLVVAGTEPVKEAVRQNPDGKAIADKLEGAVAGLTVKDGLRLELTLVTSDPAAVKTAQEELEKGKQALQSAVESLPDYGPILVELLKGVTLTADGGKFKLRSEVSGEVIERVINKTK